MIACVLCFKHLLVCIVFKVRRSRRSLFIISPFSRFVNTFFIFFSTFFLTFYKDGRIISVLRVSFGKLQCLQFVHIGFIRVLVGLYYKGQRKISAFCGCGGRFLFFLSTFFSIFFLVVIFHRVDLLCSRGFAVAPGPFAIFSDEVDL